MGAGGEERVLYGMDGGTRRAMYRENALKLFPRLAGKVGM